MTSNINYRFFWGGIYSNWYSSTFTLDGVVYNCTEQYMMHQKALLFNDHETAEEIMQTSNPRIQKKLGRVVKGYDQNIWNEHKYEIVKNGCRAKFTQNLLLKKKITDDRGKILVEASPEDAIWGIGYDEDNALANKATWGQNLLGKLLTELTNEIEFTKEDAAKLKWMHDEGLVSPIQSAY